MNAPAALTLEAAEKVSGGFEARVYSSLHVPTQEEAEEEARRIHERAKKAFPGAALTGPHPERQARAFPVFIFGVGVPGDPDPALLQFARTLVGSRPEGVPPIQFAGEKIGDFTFLAGASTATGRRGGRWVQRLSPPERVAVLLDASRRLARFLHDVWTVHRFPKNLAGPFEVVAQEKTPRGLDLVLLRQRYSPSEKQVEDEARQEYSRRVDIDWQKIESAPEEIERIWCWSQYLVAVGTFGEPDPDLLAFCRPLAGTRPWDGPYVVCAGCSVPGVSGFTVYVATQGSPFAEREDFGEWYATVLMEIGRTQTSRWIDEAWEFQKSLRDSAPKEGME